MKTAGRVLIFALMVVISACGLNAATGAKAEHRAKSETTATAAEAVPTPIPAPSPAPVGQIPGQEFSFPVLRTLGALGVVLTLMLVGFFVAKRFFPQYFARNESPRVLKIIETLPMGDRRSIALIQFANSRFLVGSTPHQINLLTALQDHVPLISEPDDSPAPSKRDIQKEAKSAFGNLFEVEKKRPSRTAANPLPEEVRNKMRRLREALEK